MREVATHVIITTDIVPRTFNSFAYFPVLSFLMYRAHNSDINQHGRREMRIELSFVRLERLRVITAQLPWLWQRSNVMTTMFRN